MFGEVNENRAVLSRSLHFDTFGSSWNRRECPDAPRINKRYMDLPLGIKFELGQKRSYEYFNFAEAKQTQTIRM